MSGTGQRNRLITVERRTVTEDDYGGEIETWGIAFQEWADVRFSKGTERRQAAQEGSQAAATFIVLDNDRTRTISVTDRIRFDGAEWDIVSAIPSRVFNAEREIEAVRTLS